MLPRDHCFHESPFSPAPQHESGTTVSLLRSQRSRPFRIIEFLNRSGSGCFRVAGWLRGERIRRNFRTRELAEAAWQVFEAQRVDSPNQLRIVATRLSDQQLKDAEAAFALLDGKSTLGLTAHVQRSLVQDARKGNSMLLKEAIEGYLALKRKEKERGALSDAAFWSIEGAMRRLCAHPPPSPA